MDCLSQLVDIDEFFNLKYKNYNNGYGIGGVGVISPLNSLRVYNLDDFEKKSNSIAEFIAPHEDTFSVVFGLM